MIPVNLLNDLVEFLNGINKDYRLLDEKVKDNPLIIVPGWLKQKERANEIQYPHIVPRFLGSEDGADGVSRANLRIYYGTYCEDVNKGGLELFNLLEHNRQALLKTRTIANKHRLDLPVKVVIPEEQPYPEWVGYIDVQYIIGQPLEEVFPKEKNIDYLWEKDVR